MKAVNWAFGSLEKEWGKGFTKNGIPALGISPSRYFVFHSQRQYMLQLFILAKQLLCITEVRIVLYKLSIISFMALPYPQVSSAAKSDERERESIYEGVYTN